MPCSPHDVRILSPKVFARVKRKGGLCDEPERGCTLGGLCAVFLSVSPASAQKKTTASEVRRFQVVSVDGNKVVVKGQRGSQEITALTTSGSPSTARKSPCTSCNRE